MYAARHAIVVVEQLGNLGNIILCPEQAIATKGFARGAVIGSFAGFGASAQVEGRIHFVAHHVEYIRAAALRRQVIVHGAVHDESVRRVIYPQLARPPSVSEHAEGLVDFGSVRFIGKKCAHRTAGFIDLITGGCVVAGGHIYGVVEGDGCPSTSFGVFANIIFDEQVIDTSAIFLSEAHECDTVKRGLGSGI